MPFRVCMIDDHDQKQIEYVCVFPECNQSRFACRICVQIGNHKHQQQHQSHVLHHKELYEVIQKNLSNSQKQQGFMKQGGNLQIQPLRQITQLIQNSLKQITNMIQQLEQGMDYGESNQQLTELLLKLRNNGFNEFDDVSINILMNVDQQIGDIKFSLLDQSNSIIQNATRIKEWCNFQKQFNALEQNKKCQVQIEGDYFIQSSTISNDLKYIVSGGNELKLKIWDYTNNTLIKATQLDKCICKLKFTDDSRLLYVGGDSDIFQFDVNNNFKQTYKKCIHRNIIINIFCITNTIILTGSIDYTIIKTDVNLKQQLLLIKAHDDYIYGLDYNHNLGMIASSSCDGSIKIWNGISGQLVLKEQNAHNNNFIQQLLFIIKGNQLITLDNDSTILIYEINYQTKQLEQQHKISDTNKICNISLGLNQLYLTLVCKEYIKIYSIQGDYIKQINHDVKELVLYNTIQPHSMKAIIIQGENILQICQVELDFD